MWRFLLKVFILDNNYYAIFITFSLLYIKFFFLGSLGLTYSLALQLKKFYIALE